MDSLTRSLKKMWRVEVTYSRHDGGWYAEVWDMESGRTAHQTDVCRSRPDAESAASEWIAKQP